MGVFLRFLNCANGSKLRKGSQIYLSPLSTNFTKWSNTFKQFVGKLSTNCLSVFDQFVGLALKGLIRLQQDVLDYYTLIDYVHSGE